MCCVDSSWLFDWLRILPQMKAVSFGKRTGQTLKGHGSLGLFENIVSPLCYTLLLRIGRPWLIVGTLDFTLPSRLS